MSKLLRWSVCGLAVAFVLGVCANSYATVSYTITPWTSSSTVSYAGGPADYMSRADIYGTTSPPGGNDLANLNTSQGGPAAPTGFLNKTIGIGEIITPQTGSTYGAVNNHSFAVKTLTAPIGSDTSGGSSELITLRIFAGSMMDGGNPVAPNTTSSTATWVTSSTLFNDTFTWDSAGHQGGFTGGSMLTFDLSAAGLTFNLDSSYLVAFSWTDPNSDGATKSSFMLNRAGPIDPGGQIMGFSDPSTGWHTQQLTGSSFSAGAPRVAAMAFNAVPEPGTVVLLGLAAPALAWAARRRKS